jgi:hypothetical protein
VSQVIKLNQLSTEQLAAVVKQLLEGFYWLPGLQANTRYARLHDDHDGECDGWLSVTIGEDGDAWVDPINATGGGLRFRMPLHGGGASPRVRTALMILAEAIRLDNEENPLQAKCSAVTVPNNNARWVCPACHTVNAIDAQTCEGCKKQKPEGKPA